MPLRRRRLPMLPSVGASPETRVARAAFRPKGCPIPGRTNERPYDDAFVERRETSMRESETTASVVLVHGAWADGSSWGHVIKPLQSRGLKVLAAPIPLTSLSDDIAAFERALERTDGPGALVAHAYAGVGIGASINDRTRALVFIGALALDEGQTVAEVFYRDKPHPEAPQLAPDRHGFIWMPDERFGTAFCQHASAEQAALLAATQ